MRTYYRRATLALIALAGVAAMATAAAPVSADSTTAGHPDRTRLQQDADAIHALGITGVQARLLTAGGRQHVATSGVADLTTGRPVPPDGYFRIASTAKTFVATVVLQLVGEGKLSLDDTVERWLPGVVQGNGNDGSRITVRQLLQHTHGIHDDFPDFTSEGDYYQHRYDIYTAEQLVARAMRHQPDFPPGTAWGYSTTGYVLAEMIIERVTGRPWHKELAHRITRPLGLRHTFWPGYSPAVPRPHARAYQPFETPALVDVTEQIPAYSQGGTFSTTRDLNVFLQALLGGRLLRPAQLAEMKRTVAVSPEFEEFFPGARYGLGLFQRPLPCGGSYWSHGGGGAGYITNNGVTEAGRRSVVVSTSSLLGHSLADVLRQEHAADNLVAHALCGNRPA
jgi:D-alanyl-D-alanine carboxypeptidase